MEKIKVVFEVEYLYEPSLERPCLAKVKLRIPANKHGYIPTILRNPEAVVFGDYLTANWGINGGQYRVYETTIDGDDWEEVKEEVERTIEETVETLKEVKEKNLNLLKQKPETTVYVYEI